LHRLISSIQDGGALAGVVLNPATPIETLDVILPQVDFVLIMSVNPGFGGQKFLPLALSKIQKLAQKREELGLSFKIEVDGGVAPGTAADVVRAGADILVSGSGLFARERPIAENVSALRHAIEAAF
jgi:ribulose-phosphate 3-epimerase